MNASVDQQDLAPLIRLELGEPAAGGSVDPSAPWFVVSADAGDAGGLFDADFTAMDHAIQGGDPTDMQPIDEAIANFSADCR